MDSPESVFILKHIRIAAAYARAMYEKRASVEVSTKIDANDVLTEADLGVQRMLWVAIQEAFPGDSLVAEEDGYARMPEDTKARCWVIDPIDGTQNFIRGIFPSFGISVAFMEGGVLKAGAIALPVMNNLFYAEMGKGAYRATLEEGASGESMRVTDLAELMPARLELDMSSLGHRPAVLERFGGLVCTMGQVRTHGAATVGLLAVAAGQAEAYVHVGLSLWDFAAGLLLALEAGGKATTLNGAPIPLDQLRTSLVVTNGALHEELLAGIVRKKG